MPLSDVPVTDDWDATTLSAQLDEEKALIVELKSTETKTARQPEALLDETKQRLAEDIGVWNKTSAENANSLVNNVKFAKADSVMKCVERNLGLARLEEHVRALQALVKANVERNGTLKDVMTTVRDLLESGRHIKKSDNTEKISKLTREVQRLTVLMESKNSDLQTMPGLVEEASRLRDDIPKAKGDRERVLAEN